MYVLYFAVCRSVYDGPEPEKFLDRLDARIKLHNKEIERMCNHHYQGFIESVHSLLQVRGDVEKLKVCISVFRIFLHKLDDKMSYFSLMYCILSDGNPIHKSRVADIWTESCWQSRRTCQIPEDSEKH